MAQGIKNDLLVKRWVEVSQKVVSLAQEMPEEAMDRPLIEGARSIGEILRHVAFWNHFVANTLRGRPADDKANELPRSTYSTKASMIAALRDSSKAVHDALGDGPSQVKTAEIVLPFIEHSAEHYGQLVVYSRLLGVVPPASR